MPFGFGKQETSLEELQEENERLQVTARNKDLELSIAQRNAALKKLKEAGLSGGSFNWNWKSILAWVKSH